MKINSRLFKTGLVFVAGLIFFSFNSCHETNNYTTPVNGTNLSGKWSFNVIPDVSYQDTTVLHSVAATEFPEGSSSYDEIYLYEDENYNIYGETWGYKILGQHIGNTVTLAFCDNPDGPLNTSVGIENMNLFTMMELQVDEFGMLNGGGSYAHDNNQPWTLVDSYLIVGNKLNDVSNPYLKTSIKKILCDLASSFSSYVISILTDGAFRPMASCYGHKDGGGYYAFGHEGPGSIFPIYTQTVYIAWEWSWCKVRKYDFAIELAGENIGYTALKATIKNMEPVFSLLKKLGFSDLDVFEQFLDEFYNKYGGFSISTAYDTHTHNMSLYVNHEKGSSSDAVNDPMIQTLKDGLGHLCGTISVYAGHTIHDSWHMRRSDVGVCNSDLIIFYLFGTHNVIYN